MDRMSGEFATPLIHMEFAALQLSYDNAHNLDRIVSVHVILQYNQCVMRYISRVFERAAHIERLAPSLIAAGRPIGQVFEWVGGSIFLEKRTRGTSTARHDHMAEKVLIGGSVWDLGPLLHATIK